MPKYFKNRGVFCHVTCNEMTFSEVRFGGWQPCLFSGNLKSSCSEFLRPLLHFKSGEGPGDEVVRRDHPLTIEPVDSGYGVTLQFGK